MKKTTLLKRLLAVCIATSTLYPMGGGNLQAQNIAFTDNYSLANGLRQQHRTVATWADLDNNNKMDFYYCGTSMTHSWHGYACFSLNQGTGFTQVISTDDTSRSAYGVGSVAFDADQDGYVDLLIQSRGGNDTDTRKRYLFIKNDQGTSFTESNVGLNEVTNTEGEWIWYWDWNQNGGSGADLYVRDRNSPFNGPLGFNGDYNGNGYDPNWNSDNGNEYNSVAVGDYDKDGYPDLCIMGIRRESNRIQQDFVTLYHNNGNGTFTEVTNHGFAQKSQGGVAFADFNNDGWLDVVLACGPYDNGYLYVYQNNQNGTFTEIESVRNAYVGHQASFNVMDINQDGRVDIVITGFVNGVSNRPTVALLNQYSDGNLSFTLENLSDKNVIGTNESRTKTHEIRDLNGDGWVDFIFSGYSNLGNYHWGISSSNGAYNSFELNASTSAPGSYWQDQYMTFGDANGDYLADGISFNSGWGDAYGEGARFALNTTSATVALPSTPTIKSAIYNKEEGNITLNWDGVKLPGSNGKAMYNVYIKNEKTGKTYTMVAANTESGFQKAYASFGSYTLCESYTFENVTEPGIYTVGVQSVAYSYAASEFATKTIAILDENTAVAITEDATADVVLNRTLKAGVWNTFCVPFNMTAAQIEAAGLGQVKTLSSVTSGTGYYTLNFTDATAIEAGKAYLVQPENAISKIETSNVNLSAASPEATTVDGVTFIGTYAPTTISNGEYFIVDNAFYIADKTMKAKGYRAYITLPAGIEVNRMLINIDGVTGVSTIAAEAEQTVDVYTVSGVRVKNDVKESNALDGLQKGLYIVNGKIVTK